MKKKNNDRSNSKRKQKEIKRYNLKNYANYDKVYDYTEKIEQSQILKDKIIFEQRMKELREKGKVIIN